MYTANLYYSGKYLTLESIRISYSDIHVHLEQ